MAAPPPLKIVLRDGRPMVLRPLRPEDRNEHRAFVERLSRRSSRFRFFVPLKTLESRQQDPYFDLDFVDRVALVACFPGETAIRAVGRYALESTGRAEVALVVEDELQGQGLGTQILRQLAVAARANGIATFTAWVLADNEAMLEVFRATGWPMRVRLERGVGRVELDLGTEGHTDRL
jgi:GNAT superfamily N-acetyltransferase